MPSINYLYTFTIIRSGGGLPLTFTYNDDSETKARLKAKALAKTMKGILNKKFVKTIAPRKTKDGKKNELQDALMDH